MKLFKSELVQGFELLHIMSIIIPEIYICPWESVAYLGKLLADITVVGVYNVVVSVYDEDLTKYKPTGKRILTKPFPLSMFPLFESVVKLKVRSAYYPTI